MLCAAVPKTPWPAMCICGPTLERLDRQLRPGLIWLRSAWPHHIVDDGVFLVHGIMDPKHLSWTNNCNRRIHATFDHNVKISSDAGVKLL